MGVPKNFQRESFKRPKQNREPEDEPSAESSSESWEEEDSDAEFLTPKVQTKIFDTLNKIRHRDPSLKEIDEDIFHDSDFDEGQPRQSKFRNRESTIGQFARQQLLERGAHAFSDDDEEPPKTYFEQQDDARAAFLKAAADEGDGDAYLFDATDKDKDVDPAQSAVKDNSKKNQKLLNEFFGKAEVLDENEKFLRDFFMNEAWNAKKHKLTGEVELDIVPLDQDGADVEKEEKFEFRFQESDGAVLRSYPRRIVNSVRTVESRHKRHRKNKKERELEEEAECEAEIKLRQAMKKRDIMLRLQQVLLSAGCRVEPSFLEQTEVLAPEATVDAATATKDEPKSFDVDGKEIVQVELSNKERKRIKRLTRKKARENEDDVLWWLCDDCNSPIQPGKSRYDCSRCDNFTLCHRCNKTTRHPHQLLRRKVAPENMPPVDYDPDSVNEPNLPQSTINQLQALYEELDDVELLHLDLEDVKLNYLDVLPNSFGMTTEEILNMPDEDLRKVLPSTKLAAYRDDEVEGEIARKLQVLPSQKTTRPGSAFSVDHRWNKVLEKHEKTVKENRKAKTQANV